MKVKISNYPDRLKCNLHTNYMNKKYGYVDWPKEQSWFENLIEKLEDLIQTCYTPINYFLDKRKQKIKVRIDKWDTWSMDHTLAHIIVPMLKQLKETKYGAPWVDDSDVPEELKSTSAPPKENEYDTDGNYFKRWDWVLDEIIWAFDQKCRDDWESDNFKYEDDPTATFGVKLIWEDRDGRKAHQERMRNGFRLFGKYYENLWD
jgi:hypothetical protein